MKKQTIFKLLFIVLILVTIGFIIFFGNWIQGEGLSCIKDPISYYVKKTSRVCFCENILR